MYFFSFTDSYIIFFLWAVSLVSQTLGHDYLYLCDGTHSSIYSLASYEGEKYQDISISSSQCTGELQSASELY